MRPLFGVGLAVTGYLVTAGAQAHVKTPAAAPVTAVRQAISTDDLLSLEEMGPLGANDPRSPFLALSPDGRYVAVHLRRADPLQNRYELTMRVIDLATGEARVVDRGGELIRQRGSGVHTSEVPTGYPEVITPQMVAGRAMDRLSASGRGTYRCSSGPRRWQRRAHACLRRGHPRGNRLVG